ncbi:unnamed protein product [Brachionus calyciflorus]|uniref:Uncharacterized protein n=1 Tax=Brachionus calyciflorus TaxID=104777 RepID=A0A814FM54_9BILA|nr:unnamed protein product [Brachionus calyciflorus]
MFAGLLAIVIKGTADIPGGFKELWNRVDRSGRLDFFNFDPNPFTRHTFWTLTIGAFFTNLTVYGSNQGTIQRYLTVKRWQNASKALMINLVGGALLLTLTCMSGLVAYAKYYDCDLLGSKKIARGEQLLPYLVMDVLGKLHGLPGLFVATIYSAALSTISGGMNSLAAVCITDFVKPTYARFSGHFMHEDLATKITKGLALFFGTAAIGLAYLCQYFGNTILQLSLSIFGLLGGPLLGVISLGMFVKKANWVGALSGLILSTIANLWIGIGGVLNAKPVGLKPLTTEGCTNFNRTTISPFVSTTQAPVDLGPTFYRMSYMYYSLYACLITFFFGIIVSIVVEKMKWIKVEPIEPKYLANWKIWHNNRITQIVTKDIPEEEDIELNEKEEIVYF